VLGRVEYKNEEREFFTELSYYDNYREYAGHLTESQFKENPKQANSGSLKDYNHEITRAIRVGYKQAIVDNWKLKTDLLFDNTSGSGFQGSKNTKESSELVVTLQAESNFSLEAGEGNLLFGADVADRDFDYVNSSSFFPIDRDNTQSSYSAYTQLHFPLLQSLTLVAGGRYTQVKDELNDSKLYPNGENLKESADAFEFGLNYHLSDGHKVYVRGESNFRFAKVDEQAFTELDVKGLKPQTGTSIEAGWSFIQPNYSLKVDLYNLKIENEIVYDGSLTGPSGPGANTNADDSERNGVSIGADYYLTDSVLLGAEYHHINAEFTNGDNKGNHLSWVAESTGRTYINYDITTSWQLFVEGVYTGSHYRDGDNANSQDKLSSYWLGNLAVNYTRNEWSASARVDNVFDESFASSVNSWGSYYPGDGRKLMVTGSYQF
jgi:iron complex outermembrane receptor protein